MQIVTLLAAPLLRFLVLAVCDDVMKPYPQAMLERSRAGYCTSFFIVTRNCDSSRYSLWRGQGIIFDKVILITGPSISLWTIVVTAGSSAL
jgi:hypothetical protein